MSIFVSKVTVKGRREGKKRRGEDPFSL